MEFFVDTEWYMDQPMLSPLDFSKTDQEIYDLTKSFCERSPGFEPYADWRKKIGARMARFVAPSAIS